MAFRNTQYCLQVNEDGSFRSGHVERVEVLPSGREVMAQPLDFPQAELGDLLAQFNADLIGEQATLKAAVATLAAVKAELEATNSQLTQSLATSQALVAARDAQLAQADADTQAQVSAISADRDSQVAAISADRDTQVSATTSQLTTMQGRFANLIEQLGYNPRHISVDKFLKRLDQAELLMLFSDSDPNIQAIAGMLKQWKEAGWHVDFDSVEFQQAMGYLQLVEKLTPERVAAMTVDSSRSEAPVPIV